jgi:hypothetical protein
MATKFDRSLLQFLWRPAYPSPAEQSRSRGGCEMIESQSLDQRTLKFLDVVHGHTGRHNAEPRIVARQLPQQDLETRIFEPSLLLPRRILQRLQAIQDEQRALLLQEARQALALVPGRTCVRLRIAKIPQRRGDKQVCRDLLAFRSPLAVERIAIHARSTAIVRLRRTNKPVVHQGCLAHTTPGHQGDYIALGMVPGRI